MAMEVAHSDNSEEVFSSQHLDATLFHLLQGRCD